jgi:hypothetical protein
MECMDRKRGKIPACSRSSARWRSPTTISKEFIAKRVSKRGIKVKRGEIQDSGF